MSATQESVPSSQNLLSQLQHWKENPTDFVLDVLGAVPDPWQVECLVHLAEKPKSFKAYCRNFDLIKAVYKERGLDEQLALTKKWTRATLKRNYEGVFQRVSVRSAHGVGKSAVMAWTGIWFQSTHLPCKIPCTAPSAHQLEDVLWAEMSMWHKRMPEFMQKQFKFGSEKIELIGKEKESFAVARTSRRETPESLQGFHSDNLAFLIDEASGIFDPVFELAEGALTGENATVLMCANPTRTQGYFFNSHHVARHLWHTMKVGHADSPRVSERAVESYRVQYGENSNVFAVRMLGEFPSGDDDAVIPLYMAEAAIGRDVAKNKGPIIWGLDVARFGDDRTTLVKRKMNHVMEKPRSWRNKDTMQTVGIVVMEWEDTPQVKRPEDIIVDVIGLGSGVVDRLREAGLPVTGLNVAENPSIKERYLRLRDELWFRGREWFERADCVLPAGCEELVAELVQPRYRELSSGKFQVESKEEVKKRTLRRQSPDLADAMLLTLASNKQRHSRKPLKYPKYTYA